MEEKQKKSHGLTFADYLNDGRETELGNEEDNDRNQGKRLTIPCRVPVLLHCRIYSSLPVYFKGQKVSLM